MIKSHFYYSPTLNNKFHLYVSDRSLYHRFRELYCAFDCHQSLGKLRMVVASIIVLQQQMGNSQFAIPSSLSHEWIEIGRPGDRLIHNTISQENFVLYKLAKDEALDTRAYVQRSIYALPRTPRLIIIDDTADHFYFLVQAPANNFKYFARRKQLLIEALLLLKDLTTTARQLRQKYGGFEIRENMIGVLRNEEAILWVHQNYHCNSPQFPLTDSSRDEEIMIKSLVSICQQHLKVDLSFILKQIAGALTFQIFLKHLSIKIEIQKFRLAQKNIPTIFPSRSNFPTGTKDQNDSKKQLARTNTNLKNFDKASITEKPSTFLHKRNYTYSDFQMGHQRTRSQLKTPQKGNSPTPSFANPNSAAAVKAINTSPQQFPMNKKQTLLTGSFRSPDKAPPRKIGHLRGTTGSLPFSEISFSRKARPIEQPNSNQIRDWKFKQQEKNVATRSSEEGCEQQFQQRQFRRQSTIKCVEDELWCERSIQEDYKCLFIKPNLQKKPYLTRIQEELNIRLE